MHIDKHTDKKMDGITVPSPCPLRDAAMQWLPINQAKHNQVHVDFQNTFKFLNSKRYQNICLYICCLFMLFNFLYSELLQYISNIAVFFV